MVECYLMHVLTNFLSLYRLLVIVAPPIVMGAWSMAFLVGQHVTIACFMIDNTCIYTYKFYTMYISCGRMSLIACVH